MKKWLERNKIYFEIFSFICLGIMGIIVSNSQLKIAELELKLHKNELQPQIRLGGEYLKNDSTGNYVTITREIYNDGNAIKNFECKIKVFYKISYTKNSQSEEIFFYVPIIDFYNTQISTGQLRGKLLTAIGIGNNDHYSKVYFDCLKDSTRKGGEFCFIDKVETIFISYKDVNNEFMSVYFIDEKECDKYEYDNLINESKKYFKNKMYSYDEFNYGIVKQILNDFKKSPK